MCAADHSAGMLQIEATLAAEHDEYSGRLFFVLLGRLLYVPRFSLLYQ